MIRTSPEEYFNKLLDLKRNVVTLERPGEGRMRTVPIGRDVHKLLARYLAYPSGEKFRRRMSL